MEHPAITSSMELRLLSVNVGTPRVIGTRDGAPLISAIGKTPVESASIAATILGLAGDTQANPHVHGGVDKAVYAYPADNWTWWEKERRLKSYPASFGENLTLEGADETHVCIGDRFLWGDLTLEVSQPRSPCNKLAVFSGRSDIGAVMTISGRCGWYLRVLNHGAAPTRGASLTRVSTGNGPTVREAFHAGFNKRLDPGVKRAMAATPALSDAWRAKLI